MPALLELQRAFAQALQGEAAAVHCAQLPIVGADAAQRVAVHAATRLGTLTRALSLNFPVVQRLVGADFFAASAHAFILETPPERACLDDYGARFPSFLQDYAPSAHLLYLADVARLEWAVSRALHARDVAGLDLGRLAALDAAAGSTLVFVPHPAIALLQLQWPADRIWQAVLEGDESAMAALDLDAGPVFLLVEREASGGATVARLAPSAWRLTQRLCAGEPWHTVLEQAQAEWPAGEGTEAGEGLEAGDAIHPINALLAEHLLRGRFIDLIASGEQPT